MNKGMDITDIYGHLICPETKSRLTLMSYEEADTIDGGRGLVPAISHGYFSSQNNHDNVLVNEDGSAAYIIASGSPILISCEMIVAEGSGVEKDTNEAFYREAYEEREHYDQMFLRQIPDIESSDLYRILKRADSSPLPVDKFPHPKEAWLDSVYDCIAQNEAYEHLSPIKGKRIMQLGGSGLHAVKFLLAGASESWLVSPMTGELEFCKAMAGHFGVADRLVTVCAIAEELPFADNMFDGIYSGGCIHHTVTSASFAEANRVLKPGGRFAAVDPWRAPFYGIGTRVFGKREKGVHCHPMTRERIAPFIESFKEARIIQHGAITRYFLLALSKLGFSISLNTAWAIFKADDSILDALGLRRFGSSILMLGEK